MELSNNLKLKLFEELLEQNPELVRETAKRVFADTETRNLAIDLDEYRHYLITQYPTVIQQSDPLGKKIGQIVRNIEDALGILK